MRRKPTASRFKPLSEFERNIGFRIAYIRRPFGMSQSELASTLQITRNQLSNIESGRVPLNAVIGLRACRLLNLNPAWLLTGHGQERGFPKLDTAVSDWLGDHFKLASRSTFGETWSSIAWFLSDYPETLALRERALPRLREQLIAKNKSLSDVGASVNHPDVKSYWKELRQRLNEATQERGKKSELAGWMNLPLASISRWLSGDAVPDGENTLRLQAWPGLARRK